MKLSLFFTFGVSARLWKEKGLLDREKLIYEKLLESGIANKIYWFTYGTTDKEIEKELKNGIEIIPMPSIYRLKIGKLFYSFLMPLVQRKYIKNTDVFKTNQMNGSWTAVLASKLYRKPLVGRAGYIWSIFAERNNNHSFFYRFLKNIFIKIIEGILYRNADISFVTNYNDAKYIAKRYKVGSNKIKIIPNYVDTTSFTVNNKKRYEDKIVFVGRLDKQKNLENLLKALTGLSYELDIYGNGPLKDGLQQLSETLKVKVNFRGAVSNSELPDILNQYPLFILPSLYEGMPKALLEAMACGCAVIGTDVDGIRELIKDNVNGILCDTTPESIGGTIEKVIKDKELQERLGKQARAFVVENYSLKTVAANELTVYKEICSV